MKFPVSSVLSVACLIRAAAGFKGTYPLAAFATSDAIVDLLKDKEQPNVFTAGGQSQSPLGTSPSVCSIDSISVISAPGLHATDLELPVEIPRLFVPYNEIRRGAKSLTLVETFVKDCGGVVHGAGEPASLWEGDKSVYVYSIDGLAEDVEPSARLQTLRDTQALVHSLVERLSGASLVVLTGETFPQGRGLSKRQWDEEYDEEYEAPQTVSYGESYAKNGTSGESIFSPAPNAGLFHKYQFTTPYILFAAIISLVILLPAALYGTQALTSIQTLRGLETKMAGTVGIDPSKS